MKELAFIADFISMTNCSSRSYIDTENWTASSIHYHLLYGYGENGWRQVFVAPKSLQKFAHSLIEVLMVHSIPGVTQCVDWGGGGSWSVAWIPIQFEEQGMGREMPRVKVVVLAFVCMGMHSDTSGRPHWVCEKVWELALTSIEDDELGKFLFEGNTSRFSVLIFSWQKNPLFEITRELWMSIKIHSFHCISFIATPVQ